MNTFSDPKNIIHQFDILPSHHVADFGAGIGSYTLAVAELLDPSKGKIFAVDVQKDLLTRISQQAEEKKLSPVHIIWGDLEEEKGSRLRHDSIDVVLIANTLFQIEERSSVLKEAYRVLKQGGKCIIIDWSESFGNIGPSVDHVISEKTARLLSEELGFEFIRTFDAGEHHYGFILTKK